MSTKEKIIVKGQECTKVENGYKTSYISKKTGRVLKVQKVCKDPSKCQQHLKEKADINNIIKTTRTSGRLDITQLNPAQPVFADFSNAGDFLEAQRKVTNLYKSFDSLPAKVKNKFRNKPEDMINFVQNEANNEECYELGLKNRPKQEVPIVEEAPKTTE